jgi:hypothetical protein
MKDLWSVDCRPPIIWGAIQAPNLSKTIIKRDGSYKIVIRTLSGFILPVSTTHLFSRIFMIDSKIVESLGSCQKYPAKSAGKQGEELLIVALVKSWQDSLSGI